MEALSAATQLTGGNKQCLRFFKKSLGSVFGALVDTTRVFDLMDVLDYIHWTVTDRMMPNLWRIMKIWSPDERSKENDITWSYLLTMEKEDLEKIGITDPEDQRKVLTVMQQMHLDKVDPETISQLGLADSGSEELQNFLLSINQQCCYLTENIQHVLNRFPRQPSQLVFSLDPKKEAQAICKQLVVQSKDLQKEVTCLRNLLCQMDEFEDCCQPPQAGSHNNRRIWSLTTRATLSVLGITFLVLLYKGVSGKVSLQYTDAC